MKKQYACLKCGRVHTNKITERVRYDERMGKYDMRIFHGYITYRVCPECSNMVEIKVEKDKRGVTCNQFYI